MLNGLIQWIYLGSLLDFKLNLALFLCSFSVTQNTADEVLQKLTPVVTATRSAL